MVMIMVGCTNPEQIRKEQLMTSGLILYQSHCQNCHGATGKGLGKLIPPLEKSDYLFSHQNSVICGIKYGWKDTLKVNGVSYAQPMPGNPDLKDQDIAQLITYITNDWGNTSPLIEPDTIKNVLKHCK